MLVKGNALWLSIGIVIGFTITAAVSIAYNAWEPKAAEAINVVGGEIVTTDKTHATYRIFKSDVETVETTATDVAKDFTGGDKTDGDKIAGGAKGNLQFLVNFHQSLADIQAENPCPSLADWKAAGGVPGGTEPNPPEYPDCDPDVLYNPARCTLFWEDLEAKVDHPVLVDNPMDTLTSRNVIIGVQWDGTIYNLSLRDPRPPANYPDNC